MRLPTAAALGAVCAFVASAAGQASPPGTVLEPAAMEETFGGEGLGQWASYPPAQDAGYDPSLTPTAAFDPPGGRALMRAVAPTAPGPLHIGFIKELPPFVTTAGADFAFAYRVEPPGVAATIEVGLAGGDGRRYGTRLSAPTGVWARGTVRLADFRDGRGQPPGDEMEIEAVYIVAAIERASPDVTHRFLIDDVRLAAAREAAFDIRQPRNARLDPWRARPGATVYRDGGVMAVEAAAPVPLRKATWTLAGPAGQPMARGALHDDGRSGDRRANDGTWSSSTVHRVSAADPRGVWRLTLGGATADGRRVQTEVRLLVLPPRSTGHPRLLFDAREVETLRARRQHPARAALWAALRKAAAASRETGPIAHGGEVFARLDPAYLLPSLLSYFDVLNRARARITDNAVVGFVDDDAAARAAAGAALLEVSRWPAWAPPWFEAHGQHTYYPAGQLASAVALGYDLLYADLSAEERRLVRRALLERSILPTWREYVLDNRVMADTSNWISHTVGGSLLAAAAIVGDGSPEEDEALALPVNGLLMKIEDHMAASFLPDGSYGEGISYQEFDLETLGPTLWAMERVFGQSYWEGTAVLDSLRYPLHTLAQPPSESLDQGDTHPPAGHGIGSVVSRSPDPVIRWYGRQFEPRTAYDFILFNEDVPPQPPLGAGSRLFEAKGNAVFRSGWEADSAIVLFRAGPTFNHNHRDQGAFLVRGFGETLATEAGWSDYYKDPYYGSFFTQPIGHNTLLVDGDPESQRIADTRQFAALNLYPKITDFVASGFYDAVGSDLTPAYPQLSSYTRRLAFLKPDLLLVFDRVRARKPSRFDVLLHVSDRDRAEVDSGGGSFAGARAAFALRTFASEPVESRLRDGRLPYAVLATRTPAGVPPRPAFFDVRTTREAADAWVISALAMGRRRSDAEAVARALTPVSAPGLAGVRMTRDGRDELVLIRLDEGTAPLAFERWRTDAAAWMARDAPVGTRIGLQRARELQRDGRVLLQADAPIDAAVQFVPALVEADVRSERPAVFRLFMAAKPARVAVGGREVPSGRWRYGGQMVSVPVPSGESHVSIMAAAEIPGR